MAYSVQYFDEVATDINEAKLWYKQKKEGLEIEFAFAVREALESIAKMPTAYTTRYKACSHCSHQSISLQHSFLH